MDEEESLGAQSIISAKKDTSKIKKRKKSASGTKRRKPKLETSVQTGAIANVGWRALHTEALRLHPQFASLRPPQQATANKEKTLATAAVFRQDTWQWDAIHVSRITGSRAAALLGFFEGIAVSELGIPVSLRDITKRKKALALAQEDYQNLDLDALFVFADALEDTDSCVSGTEYRWTSAENDRLRFPYRLNEINKSQQKKISSNNAASARLRWGTVQEAVGVLAAINYYEKAACIAESGMLAGEVASLHALAAEWKDTAKSADAIDALSRLLSATSEKIPLESNPSTLRLGASPDGIIVYQDGTVEVLEVKSVSPFVKAHRSNRIALKDRGPHLSIGAWLIPQVMLEIFCAGPACKGAKLVSVSATKGAAFFTIPRNDTYIQSMLEWLASALENHPRHFDQQSYLRFLKETRRIADSAIGPVIVADIQRPGSSEPFFHDNLPRSPPSLSPSSATLGGSSKQKITDNDQNGKRLSVDW